MPCAVSLPLFEGTINTLLDRLNREEMEILDLPVFTVISEYHSYLQQKEENSLDEDSAYLVPLAALLERKSQALLPLPPPVSVPEREENLEEIEKRLAEYRKFKNAAAMLCSREKEFLDSYARTVVREESPAPLLEVSIVDLICVLRNVLQKEDVPEMSLYYTRVDVTVPHRMKDIWRLLRKEERFEFVRLFDGFVTRIEIVVTFLALLELARLRKVRILQEGFFGRIFVERRRGASNDK